MHPEEESEKLAWFAFQKLPEVGGADILSPLAAVGF
jgi:hypothetical protein